MSPGELAAQGRCLRARDGGWGPRACGELACSRNLRAPGSRGPEGRVRLQVLVEDTCADDVSAVVRVSGVVLSHAALGRLLGASKQSVQRTYASAMRKLGRLGAHRRLFRALSELDG